MLYLFKITMLDFTLFLAKYFLWYRDEISFCLTIEMIVLLLT
jgi:hypothetical protein